MLSRLSSLTSSINCTQEMSHTHADKVKDSRSFSLILAVKICMHAASLSLSLYLSFSLPLSLFLYSTLLRSALINGNEKFELIIVKFCCCRCCCFTFLYVRPKNKYILVQYKNYNNKISMRHCDNYLVKRNAKLRAALIF